MAGIKTDKEKILEFLSDKEQGAKSAEIALCLQKTIGITNSVLSPMTTIGYLERLEPGLYRISEKGLKSIGLDAIQKPPPPIPEASTVAASDAVMVPEEKPPEVKSVLPSEYDRFCDIGSSVGIQDKFLKVAADTLFLGNMHDLDYVWRQLNNLYLRPDITKRIFNLWATFIDQPVSPELAEAAQAEPAKKTAQAAGVLPATRFNVLNDEIVADPEGEFTFTQARQYLMTRAIQNSAPSIPQDKVSEIIASITPLMTPKSETGTNSNDVLIALLPTLIENSKQQPQQQMSPTDLVNLIIAVSDKMRPAPQAQLNPVEQMTQMVGLYEKLGTILHPNDGKSSVTVPIKGIDGSIGAISLTDFFTISDYKRKVEREEEEIQGKKDTGKTVRTFIDNLGKAAKNLAEKGGGGETK